MSAPIPFEGKALLAVSNPSPSIEAYEGSVRSSKTFTSLLDWLSFVRTGPAGNLLMTGKTERTIINNLLLPLQELFGEKRIKINLGAGHVDIFGRKVLLIGANNEAARTKIQGLTLAGAYVDEAGTLPESFFNMLYSRLSVAGAKLWLTSNPEGPVHWLKVNWLDKARLWIDKSSNFHHNDSPEALDLHRYTFILEDNKSLSAEYVERTKKSYSGLFYLRYILAEWVAAEGAIYDSWEPETHVIPWADLPHMQRLLALGIDYGTSNATSAILLGLGVDNKLYAVDEWRHEPKATERSLTDGDQSKRIREWLGKNHVPNQELSPEWVTVDPAAASFKVQLQADGLSNVMNADNDVLYGIRTVASLLATGNLIISDRCTGLTNEFPGYSWDPKATAEGEDKPLKVADHSLDALRYAIVTTETNWRPRVNINSTRHLQAA